MTNYRSDKQTDLEIAVDKICIASKHYSIKPLVEDDTSRNNINLLNGHSISWQEQAAMHYIISPLESNTAHCTLTQCHLGDRDQGSNSSRSVTDFICLEHAHDQFTATMDMHQKQLARMEAEQEQDNQGPRSIAEIRRAKSYLSSDSGDDGDNSKSMENAPKCHPTSLAFLCSPHHHSSSEINVICSWKTKGEKPDEIIVGQHHLRQLAVRPQHKSQSCPLLIGANYNPSVQHDFSTSPLNLDMEISIRNRLVQSKVDFEFSLQSRPDFDFIGPECFRKTLDGGEEIVFPLEAVIFQSGMYNLQCVKLTVHNNDGSKTPYVFPLQWIVQVNT